MAYQPVYAPLNLEVLQGVLDRSQARYDVNTQKGDEMSNFLASLDATRPYDVQKKEEFRNLMQSEIQRLDKAYNYDRSSGEYAKELTNVLSRIKGDAYWPFKKKADEIAARRNKLMDEKGSMFHESIDPFDPTKPLTEKNMSALDQWRPYDLQDFITAGVRAGVGLSKEIKGIVANGQIAPWLRYYATQTGFTNEAAAAKFIDEEPVGQQRLKEAVEAAGGNMNDPKLVATVRAEMIKSSVGQRDYNDYQDLGWIAAQKDKEDKKDDVVPTIETGTVGGIEDYKYKTLSEARQASDNLQTTYAEIAKREELIAQMPEGAPMTQYAKEQLDVMKANAAAEQYEIDRINNKVNQMMEGKQGQKVKATGLELVQNEWGLTGAEAEKKYNEMLDYFIKTNAAQRSMESEALGRTFSAIKTAARVAREVARVRIGSTRLGYAPKFKMNEEDIQDYVTAAQNITATLDDTAEYASPSMINYAMLEAEDVLAKRYAGKGEWLNNQPDSRTRAAYMDEFIKAYKRISEFRKYYSASRDYADSGFATIENPTQAELEKGEPYVIRKINFSPGVKSTEAKPFFDFAITNMNDFDVYEITDVMTGRSKPVPPEEVEAIKQQIKDDSYHAGSFGFDPERSPMIFITGRDSKDDKKVKQYVLKMNIAKQTTDVQNEYARLLNRPEFLDGIYEKIKFTDREYSVDDEDGYLETVLKNYGGIDNPELLSGISFQRITDDNQISYILNAPEYGQQRYQQWLAQHPGDFEGAKRASVFVFERKPDLIRALQTIYQDKLSGAGN